MRTLFQDCTQRTGKRTLFVSVSVHGLVLGLLIVLPLISYAALPETRLVSFISPPDLADVPPPPAPEPAPSKGSEVKTVPEQQFTEPTVDPTELPVPTEHPPSTVGRIDDEAGPPVAVPAGAAGIGGVPRGVVGNPLPEPPKPEPKPATAPRPQHLQVSEGIVLSKVIRKVRPTYPLLAKQTRIDGTVLLDITIDEQGNVSEIQLRQGKPLLNQAAQEAVWQWKFSPTLLNGQPVKVKATISVVFSLN